MVPLPAALEQRLVLGSKVIVFLIACDRRGMLNTFADKKCKSVVAFEGSAAQAGGGLIFWFAV